MEALHASALWRGMITPQTTCRRHDVGGFPSIVGAFKPSWSVALDAEFWLISYFCTYLDTLPVTHEILSDLVLHVTTALLYHSSLRVTSFYTYD